MQLFTHVQIAFYNILIPCLSCGCPVKGRKGPFNTLQPVFVMRLGDGVSTRIMPIMPFCRRSVVVQTLAADTCTSKCPGLDLKEDLLLTGALTKGGGEGCEYTGGQGGTQSMLHCQWCIWSLASHVTLFPSLEGCVCLS